MVEGHLSLSLAPPGVESDMDMDDWRTQLPADARQRIVDKILETLKRHLPFRGEEGLLELKKIAVRFEEKIYAAATSQSDYLRKISLKMLTFEPMSQSTMTNSLPFESADSSNAPPDFDSTAQMGHANADDWQEETYQKIKAMKEMYLPELNEMYQKIAAKLQQHDALQQQQPKSDQLEKLKVFKGMLERIIAFLQVSKENVLPVYKEKLGSYEKQIINFINTNRPRKLVPSLQQGQLPPPQGPFPPSQMHSMQQPESHINQVQSHENQTNPQSQSMILQQHMKQQEEQCLLRQQLMRQQRQQQQQLMLRQQQQLQHLPEQLQSHQMPQLHHFNDVNDLKMGLQQLSLNTRNNIASAADVQSFGGLPSDVFPAHFNDVNDLKMGLQQLSLNTRNNIASAADVQSFGGLPSDVFPAQGITRTPMSNGIGQTSNTQNISSISQNSVVSSMGQGVPSNIFTSSPRLMHGMQENPHQQPPQHFQNPQEFLFQQQMLHQQQQVQKAFLKHKFEQSLIQSPIQQQQQKQNLSQLTKLQQSGMQTSSIMQPSVMQSAPLTTPQQQPQQAEGIHQQQLTMPPQQQQQQLLLGQYSGNSNMQTNQHSILLLHQPKNPLKQTLLIRTKRALPETWSSVMLHLCGCLVLFLLCLWLYVFYL